VGEVCGWSSAHSWLRTFETEMFIALWPFGCLENIFPIDVVKAKTKASALKAKAWTFEAKAIVQRPRSLCIRPEQKLIICST